MHDELTVKRYQSCSSFQDNEMFVYYMDKRIVNPKAPSITCHGRTLSQTGHLF
jgi:hypothetical protein